MRISWAFGILCAHTLLFQAVTFLLRPTAAYRAIELGARPALLGLLVASFALVPLLLALPAGDLADRYGEAAVMLVGAVVIAGAALLLVVDDDGFAVGTRWLAQPRCPPGRLDSAASATTRSRGRAVRAGPGLLARSRSRRVYVASFGLTVALVLVTWFVRRRWMATAALDRTV